MHFHFTLPVAEYFRARGHHVTLACSDDAHETGQSFVGWFAERGFATAVIPIKRTISPWSDIVSVVTLYRYLRRNRFDVVNIQTSKAGMIGRVAARLANVPVVIFTTHVFSFHALLSPWRARAYAFIEWLIAHCCDAIVLDSEAARARGVEFGVAPNGKLHVIPMGVDVDKFDPACHQDRRAIRGEFGLTDDDLVIGTVSRLVHDKGLECLLEAMSLLVKDHPGLKCLLAGGGPLEEELRAMARRLGLEDRVVFAGYQADVPRVLMTMDVFMMPTLREGFGLALAEAMSMERPVVATDIAPLTDLVVNDGTGLLAEARNPEAFAKAADVLLKDACKRAALGRAARDFIKANYSSLKMCQAYYEFYLECRNRALSCS